MYETEIQVSSQIVSSSALNLPNSETSSASISPVVSDSAPVTSEALPDASTSIPEIPMDESASTSIDIDLSQSIASSMVTSEIVGPYDDDRFLTKPINDYTVTEGALLVFVLLAFAIAVLLTFGVGRGK